MPEPGHSEARELLMMVNADETRSPAKSPAERPIARLLPWSAGGKGSALILVTYSYRDDTVPGRQTYRDEFRDHGDRNRLTLHKDGQDRTRFMIR